MGRRSTRAQARKLSSLCSDFFLIGMQISSGQTELPSCDALRRRVMHLFETMSSRAQRAGLLQADIQNATYALAAYLDEVIQYSNWPGKQQWSAQPLQAIFFAESQAGIHFFARLDEVRRNSPVALEIFYSCLALGFMGEYRMGDQQRLEDLIVDLRRQVGARKDSLSPHGRRPDDRGPERGGLPWGAIAIGCVLLAVGVAVLLYFILDQQNTEINDLLTKMGRK